MPTSAPQLAQPRELPWLPPLQRYIERHADRPLPLKELAAQAGVSVGHLQRRFKARLGISPRQYQEACRMGEFKQRLRRGESVTEALYAVGFGSSSRLYEKLDHQLGMTPSQYRAGGAGMQLSWAQADTRLGPVLMAATDRGLCFLQFGESVEALHAQLRQEFPHADCQAMSSSQAPLFEAWLAALEARLLGQAGAVPDQGSASDTDPLDSQGTGFQQQVWRYLQSIPCGEVRSYAEVAAAIGRPKAVRAVASACARNRIAVLVPCHRVIRGDGGLGGYRWGTDRKRALLDAEAATRRPD